MEQQDASKQVQDMAAQRASKPEAEYSILDAIDDALWLRRTPDGVVGADRLRKITDTLLAALQRSKCYYNAVRRGQEVFVLVQQDRAAPWAIRKWGTRAHEHGCPKEKVDAAFATAQRWEQQDQAMTKWPD